MLEGSVRQSGDDPLIEGFGTLLRLWRPIVETRPLLRRRLRRLRYQPQERLAQAGEAAFGLAPGSLYH